MGIRESIALFNTKINSTYWTRQEFTESGKIRKIVNNPAVLPTENYCKILLKKFVKIGEKSGFASDLDTANHADYYTHTATDETIAVVKSVKTVDSVPTKIAVATYYDNHGEIVIMNRFDQMGRLHDNYLDVYGSRTNDEFEFYKTYLSDEEQVDPSGKTHYKVRVPHIHFNTRSQTLAFRHHDKANAISVEKLIVYLNDLKNDRDPSSYLNTIDMGMPFIDLKNAKLEYISSMMSSFQHIISFLDDQSHVTPDKFSDYEKETIDVMKSLINIDDGGEALGFSGICPDTEGPAFAETQSPDRMIDFVPVHLAKNGESLMIMPDAEIQRLVYSDANLGDYNVNQLTQIKKYLSSKIRQIEKENKNRTNERKQLYIEENPEARSELAYYKYYLKYVKGVLNLETALVDLKKYRDIYAVLNERDPHLMSFVSKELLESLTINIKPMSEKEKGGVFNEYDVRQPQ